MIDKIVKLEKDGKLTMYTIDSVKIQEYIDGIKNSLTSKYYELEKKCNLSAIKGSFYQQYFCRNVMEIPISLLKKEYIGNLKEYQYYQDIFFDNNFAIHYTLKARIKQDWSFRYIIENNNEKLPLPIIQMVKHFLDSDNVKTLEVNNNN